MIEATKPYNSYIPVWTPEGAETEPQERPSGQAVSKEFTRETADVWEVFARICPEDSPTAD